MDIRTFASLPALRRARPRVMIALALFGIPSIARADVSLQIVATDPASPAVLVHWDHLSLRISYTSDRPIRVRAQAFYSGKQVTEMTSGSPLYEAGSGDAFFWLAYTRAQPVDTITVTAEDGQTYKTLTQTSISVDLTWTGEQSAAHRAPAEWVAPMQAEQDRRVRAAMAAYENRPVEWWSTLLGFAAVFSVPVYFILQPVLLWKMRGSWRIATALPLLPMAAAVSHAMYAYGRGSNLFPIVLIFTAPFAVLYLLAVMVVRRAKFSQSA